MSPRSMLEVRNRTLPEGEWGGVMTSSASSGIARVGSDAGVAEVSLSPDSDSRSSVVFDFRKFTTLFFFLRDAWERECRPAPSDRPVVAECMLTSEGLEGRCPVPSSEPRLNVYVVLPKFEWDRVRLGVTGVEWPADSALSDGPAQALKTASRIDGVNNDNVR